MKKMNLFAPDHHCLPILYWSGSSELIFVLHVKRTKVYQYFLVLQILLMSSSRNYLCPTKEGYQGKNENSGEEGESENEKKNTQFQYVRKLEMSGGWGFLAHPSDRDK